jgi:signal transduction histidine kinase
MDLSELMQSVADQLRPEAEAARVSIDCRWDGERGRIGGDRERLRQVLINLVRNAIEAMSPTGGALELGVQPGGEGSVEAHVEDTGPGFDENAPVFDAFYTTKAGGTGLGLAIVHRIVREHGGSIHFESRAGRTRFSLRFPSSARA